MYARVEREYYPNGALKSETQCIMPYNRNESGGQNVHVFPFGFAYDLVGRRTSLTHPDTLRAYDSLATTRYVYNTLGLMDTLLTPYKEKFSFTYDDQLRQKKVRYPNGVVQEQFYDDDGRLPRRRVDWGFDPAKRTVLLHPNWSGKLDMGTKFDREREQSFPWWSRRMTEQMLAVTYATADE